MKSVYTLLAALCLLSSCKKEEDPFVEAANTPAPANEVKMVDFACDSSGSGHYTFFNLETGKEVPLSDSATDKWHIGFLSTTIIANSGNSGPGNTQAQIVDGIYNDFNTAPETGYKSDVGGTKAIPAGSGNGWYTYNSTTHLITPNPGKILCFKTTDSKYCKMEITSYYKGGQAGADPINTPSRYYSFRYLYQSNGSRQYN